MNRLANSVSPYLLSHASNPVDWYPYCEEAFDKAQTLDLPVMISIGYSACHWCHVMERESFESEKIAKFLNENFISVKVDREEHPQIDAFYMDALVLTNGHGGWPTTAFCLPTKEPFFLGTYFPDKRRGSFPSFIEVLKSVNAAYNSKRNEINGVAKEIVEAVQRRSTTLNAENTVSFDTKNYNYSNELFVSIDKLFDPKNGGFGRSPKFPQSGVVSLCLSASSIHTDGPDEYADRFLKMAEKTLNEMIKGGIYDQLAGGFARYSVDESWTVPHFEKMLYDQALIVKSLAEAYQLTHDDIFYKTVHETINWVNTSLKNADGSINSSMDADSDGREGAFYAWTNESIQDNLTEKEFAIAKEVWDISPLGNFEGSIVLRIRKDVKTESLPNLEAIKNKLLRSRSTRETPKVDEKVVLEWNAMWADTLCYAGFFLDCSQWISEAEQIVSNILRTMRTSDGTFIRARKKDQKSSSFATSVDIGWLILACLDLAQYSGKIEWLNEADSIFEYLIKNYFDSNKLYLTSQIDSSTLIRMQDIFDTTTPSANSICALAITKLGLIQGDSKKLDLAGELVRPLIDDALTSPTSFSTLLKAFELLYIDATELIMTTVNPAKLEEVKRHFLPRSVILLGDEFLELESAKSKNEDGVYICHQGRCESPILDLNNLRSALSKL